METSAQMFRDATFGGFLHWGLYAIPGGIWKNKGTDYIGEWLQAKFRIPNAEYAKLAAEFYAESFDADDWVRRFRNAGMRYVVFTAKHHDGFSMFRTKASSYNIVDAAPFHRDPLAEISVACRKYGLKLGIYYSQYLDWHEPDGGDPGPGTKNLGNVSWGNDWDFPELEKKDFGRYFAQKVVPQITELLTNYGPIFVFWCDCPIAMEERYCKALRELVHRLQPECLINSRIGHGCEDYRSLGDNQMPGNATPGLVECPATLNDTWGYKKNDHHWKNAQTIVNQLLALSEKKVNLLLNVGPKPDGAFPEETNRILEEIAAWNRENGEAVFASNGNPFPQEFDFAYCLSKGNILHFYPKKQLQTVVINGVRNKVTASSIPYRQIGEHLELDFSGIAGIFPDVPLILDGTPNINPRLTPQNDRIILLPSKGTITAGSDSGETTCASHDVDGRQLASGTHMTLANNGTLSSWHNPTDRMKWTVYFSEQGTYQLLCLTQSAGHSRPWIGEREVEVIAGSHVISSILTAASPASGDYYPQAESFIGEIVVSYPQEMDLQFFTRRLLSQEAAAMNFVSLTLKKENCR